MNHQGTAVLDTERLTLRPFTIADADAAYRNWCSDVEVTRYLTWPAHTNRSVTEKVIGNWVSRYGDPAFYQWAIELKALREPVGSIAVVSMNEDLDIAQVGYCMGKHWWHQGVMSEAFGAVIAFLFEQVGANRIEARHDPDNPRSGGVMRKCGLMYEGRLRQADRNNRGVVDVCMYSLLRSEYDANRKKPSLR